MDDLLKVILTSLSMNMTIVIQNMGTGWHCQCQYHCSIIATCCTSFITIKINCYYYCHCYSHHCHYCYYNKIATSVTITSPAITITKLITVVTLLWQYCCLYDLHVFINNAGCSFPSEVVAAMEINTTANQVYHLNFGDTNLLQKNIEVSGLSLFSSKCLILQGKEPGLGTHF